MASSLAIRLSRNPRVSYLLRPCSVSRSFNNSATVSDEGDRSVGFQSSPDRSASRRCDSSPFSSILSGVDPFFGPRSIGQMINMMDQLMDNPFMSGVSTRKGWNAKEDGNTLLLRVDILGISKEDVKISVQNNTLSIKGETQRESDEEEESSKRYSSKLDLDPNLYKLDEIKAEMKNGVLKVIVPKQEEEEDENKNVDEIKVD